MKKSIILLVLSMITLTCSIYADTKKEKEEIEVSLTDIKCYFFDVIVIKEFIFEIISTPEQEKTKYQQERDRKLTPYEIAMRKEAERQLSEVAEIDRHELEIRSDLKYRISDQQMMLRMCNIPESKINTRYTFFSKFRKVREMKYLKDIKEQQEKEKKDRENLKKQGKNEEEIDKIIKEERDKQKEIHDYSCRRAISRLLAKKGWIVTWKQEMNEEREEILRKRKEENKAQYENRKDNK